MKYDKEFVPVYVGADGKCSICGLRITLEKKDKVFKRIFNSFYVKCPICSNDICCYQKEEDK